MAEREGGVRPRRPRRTVLQTLECGVLSSEPPTGQNPVIGEPIRHGYTGVEKRLGLAARFVDWQDAAVLDVGCGNGAYTLEIAKRAARTVGIDLEAAHLAEFAERAAGAADVSMARAAGERLPFADQRFDVVFCIETLEHVSDERETLGEIRRVLRPKGHVVLAVPNKWYLFETHGLRGMKGSHRLPFASWLPQRIHRRIANARIYTAGEITRLVRDAGFQALRLDWMLPPLDKVGSRALRSGLRGLLRAAEPTPLRRFGVSIIVVARKPA